MYLVLLAVILLLVNMFGSGARDTVTKLNYTDLLKLIEEDGISNAMVTDSNILIAGERAAIFPKRNSPTATTWSRSSKARTCFPPT